MTALKSATHAVSLQLQNQTAEIARMSEWLETTLTSWGVDKAPLFRIDLSANEAVTNILSYAFPEGGQHDILLSLKYANNELELAITDDGMAFNPLAMPPHVQPATLADAQIGGLGIDLIRHYMDDCSYQRNGNKNSLILKLSLEDKA